MRRGWGLVALLGVVLLAESACTTRTCVHPSDMPAHVASRDAEVRAAVARTAHMNPDADLQILALSSGGQNGAFAAGVVNGWRRSAETDATGRPDFHIITGVSTGALLGTFVFVDTPEADRMIEHCFTTISRDDIVDERSRISIPFVESVSKSDKLRRLLGRYVTDEVIDRVATRSEDGKRLLLVATTDLDCGAMRVWDMTALARAGEYQLYRRVLLAASSIPLILPPVLIHGEMYVDGGICDQVFVPDVHAALAAQPGADPLTDPMPRGDVYVIANSAFGNTTECVQPNLPDIWRRGLATLISESMIGSLWHAWGIAQMRGFTFRMTHIPNEYTAEAADKLAFDPATMRRLYDLGVRMGGNVDSWSDHPPGASLAPAPATNGAAPFRPIEEPLPEPAPVAPEPGRLPPPRIR